MKKFLKVIVFLMLGTVLMTSMVSCGLSANTLETQALDAGFVKEDVPDGMYEHAASGTTIKYKAAFYDGKDYALVFQFQKLEHAQSFAQRYQWYGKYDIPSVTIIQKGKVVFIGSTGAVTKIWDEVVK